MAAGAAIVVVGLDIGARVVTHSAKPLLGTGIIESLTATEVILARVECL